MITILNKDALSEIDETHVRFADEEEIKAVIENCKVKRLETNRDMKGFSKDKNLRTVGDIPSAVYWHPKLKHIFRNPDSKEGARLRREFLKRYTKFRTSEGRI